MVVPSAESTEECVTIHNMSFNQCYDCFTVAASFGFAIYHAHPYRLVVMRSIHLACTHAIDI